MPMRWWPRASSTPPTVDALPSGSVERLDLEACPAAGRGPGRRPGAALAGQSRERQAGLRPLAAAGAPWLGTTAASWCCASARASGPGGPGRRPWRDAAAWPCAAGSGSRRCRCCRRPWCSGSCSASGSSCTTTPSTRGVRLIGDLPFYVAHDSADVWANRRLFSVRGRWLPHRAERRAARLLLRHRPALGHPRLPLVALHRLTGFRWWMRRLERQLELLDLLRLDHFRALEAYWSVPGEAEHGPGGPLAPVPGRGPARRLRARWQRHRRLLARPPSPAPDRRRPGGDHPGGGGPARSLRPAGDEDPAVRLRWQRRQPLPAGELPGQPLGGVHRHPRQRHQPGLVAESARRTSGARWGSWWDTPSRRRAGSCWSWRWPPRPSWRWCPCRICSTSTIEARFNTPGTVDGQLELAA